MTDPLSSIQPADDNSEPLAPVADATPEPVVPDLPVVPEAEDGKLSEAEQAEADEWDKAADELFPGLRKSEENKEDEQSKSDEKPKENEEDQKPKEDEKPKEESDESAKKDDEGAEEDSAEDEPVEPTDANARLTAREEAAQVEAVKNDIKEKMFADIPTELKDADGDPIKNVGDVMKLINPNTGQQFTAEEAAIWLGQAERQVEKNIAQMNEQVDQIAETNLNLKDQADIVNFQYGELLKAMPELRDKIWAQYEKTLTKDSKSDIITKAPVSLQQFYETALEPYAELGRTLAQQESNNTAAQEKAAADAKAAEEAKKQQIRQDRSDIYGKGKVDTATEEDKEWAAAAETVFGPLK